MNTCKIKHKWGDNFDYLTHIQFDELIKHAENCRYHDDLLTQYENSVLPVLRAALPEKTIAYREVVEIEQNFFSRFLDQMWFILSTFIHDKIIRPPYLTESIQQIDISRNPKPVVWFWGRLSFTLLMLSMSIFTLAAVIYFTSVENKNNEEVFNKAEETVPNNLEEVHPVNTEKTEFSSKGKFETPSLIQPKAKPAKLPEGNVSIVAGQFKASEDEVEVNQENKEHLAKNNAPKPSKPDKTEKNKNSDLNQSNIWTLEDKIDQKSPVFLEKDGRIFAQVKIVFSNLSSEKIKKVSCIVKSKDNQEDNKLIQAKSDGCYFGVIPNKEYIITIGAKGYYLKNEYIVPIDPYNEYILILEKAPPTKK